MQAWDQVKVIAGPEEGRAGVVQHVEEHDVTVLLDGESTPLVLYAADLQILG